MNPILRPRTSACWSSLSRATLLPSSQYSPRVGTSRQPRMFINVDLPEPEEPITATYSPASTRSDTPRRAWTAVSPWPYVLVTSRISIRASATTEATAGTRAATGELAARKLALTEPALPNLAVLVRSTADGALEQLDTVALVQARGDLGEAVAADADLHFTGSTAVGQRDRVRRTARGDRRTRDVKSVGCLGGLNRDVSGLTDPGVRGEPGKREGRRVGDDAVRGGRYRRDRGQRCGKRRTRLGVQGHGGGLAGFDLDRVGFRERGHDLERLEIGDVDEPCPHSGGCGRGVRG